MEKQRSESLMKVAFLLHGKIGGIAGKDGAGKLIDYRFCRDKFYKNIIEPSNADVFIHSWSKEQENDLMKIYSPKKAIIEEQRQFKFDESLPWLGGKTRAPVRNFLVKSRFYSSQQAMKLKREYEKENNFRYDFVMITRYDLIWLTPIDLKELDSDNFYISKINKVNHKRKTVSPHWIKTHHPKSTRYNDTYFLSNSKFMDYYGDAFDMLSNVNVGDPHLLLFAYLNENKEIKNRIVLKYLNYFDHDVYRRRVESYENGVTILKENFKITGV
jgi:hypothetical protein